MEEKKEQVLRELLVKAFCNKQNWISKIKAEHSDGSVDFFDVLFTDDPSDIPHYKLEATKGFEAESRFGGEGTPNDPWILPLSGLVNGLKYYISNHTETIQGQIDDPDNAEVNTMAGNIIQYSIFGRIEFK
jgi:hypothetical protein